MSRSNKHHCTFFQHLLRAKLDKLFNKNANVQQTTVSNNEVETEKHQKKRRKIDKVVQPFVNKIVEGTQTLSQLVKNTPLKFGNRKKHRFTVTTISPITEEGEMDVESGQSNNSESPKSESNPFSLPLDTVGRSSGRSDPMIRSARPYPDATPRRSTRTRGLKHSVSLASLPSQRRTALTIVRPPADATPYPAMITPADGWILELGSTDAAPFCVDLESKPAESEKWYSDFFAGKGTFSLFTKKVNYLIKDILAHI